MKTYYSPSERGFYKDEFHSEIPADAVEISEEFYKSLINRPEGKMLAWSENGIPSLIDIPTPGPEVLLEIAKKQRAAAFTAEADPLFFKAQRGEATLVEWQAKIEEIRARYPYPI